jgi:membrane protein implicated in regulation of membrane protease activity
MILQLDAWIFWLVLLAIFLIAEAVTVNLTTIWFAAGSLVALILDLAGMTVALQVTAMIVVSGILLTLFLIVIRPHINLAKGSHIPTNADRLIGQEGLVIEPIDPIQGTGQIRALGQTWSANSLNQQPIAADTRVVIIEIRGVKAIVTTKEANHD